MKNILLLIFVCLVFPAMAQDATTTWANLNSQMKVPLIRGSGTYVNTSTVPELRMIEMKPGKKYIIQEVDPTTPITVQAEAFSSQSGVVVSSGIVGSTDKSDWIAYPKLGGTFSQITIRYALADAQSAIIDIRTGSITGTIIKTLTLAPTGGWGTFLEKSEAATIPDVPLFFTFSNGRATGNGNLDWFKFE